MDVSTIVGLGTTAFAAIFGSGFVQFMIQRKDTRDDRIGDLEKNFDKRMDTLEDMIKDGLKEREDTGLKRFDEHEKKYNELKDFMIEHAKTDEERDKYMKCVGNGVMILIHNDIMEFGKRIEQRGAITHKEKSYFEALFKPYEELGGNGDAKALYNYCMSRTTVSTEAAETMDDNTIRSKRRTD